MTNTQKKMKKYTNTIERNLNMPREVKARVMNDFISSIQGRREAGQSDEEIFAELGDPKKVASDLNEQMKEYTYVKSPWRWACFTLSIGALLSILFGGTFRLLAYLFNASASSSIGIIGGADGPTAIFVTQSPGSAIQGTLMTILILVMSIVGFWYLGHMRKK